MNAVFFSTFKTLEITRKKKVYTNRRQIASCITLRTWCIVKYHIILYYHCSLLMFSMRTSETFFSCRTFLLVFCFCFRFCRLWSSCEHKGVRARASAREFVCLIAIAAVVQTYKKSEYKKCVKSSNHNPLRCNKLYLLYFAYRKRNQTIRHNHNTHTTTAVKLKRHEWACNTANNKQK